MATDFSKYGTPLAPSGSSVTSDFTKYGTPLDEPPARSQRKRSFLGRAAEFVAPATTRTVGKIAAGEDIGLRDVAGTALEVGSFLVPAGGIARGLGLAGKTALTLGKRALVSGTAGAAGGALGGAGRAVSEGAGFGETVRQAATGAALGGTLGAAIPPVAAMAGKVVRGVSSAFGRRAAQKADADSFQDAWEIVKPKLTPTVRNKYGEAGRVTKPGLFTKPADITPGPADQKVIEAVQPYVQSGELRRKQPPQQQIGFLRNIVTRLNAGVKNFIRENNVEFNEKQLDGHFAAAKENSRVIFGKDSTIESAYDAVIDEFKQFVFGAKPKGQVPVSDIGQTRLGKPTVTLKPQPSEVTRSVTRPKYTPAEQKSMVTLKPQPREVEIPRGSAGPITVMEPAPKALNLRPFAKETVNVTEKVQPQNVLDLQTPQTLPSRTAFTDKLFETRQWFDAVIKQKFPQAFRRTPTGEIHPTDQARVAALRDIRDAANNYIADLLPDNNPYKYLMKQESALIEAIRRIAPRSGSTIGKTKAGTFLTRHPMTKRVLKYTAATGAGAVGLNILTGD
ncbi:MAG: hypothetical protein U1A16_01930 [Patescibacteria group bacterium]|nr:hypothetical protein [Patescibacteria group bacterium]